MFSNHAYSIRSSSIAPVSVVTLFYSEIGDFHKKFLKNVILPRLKNIQINLDITHQLSKAYSIGNPALE